ncbi:2OG-Fe(II) oxygenase [Sphingobacterium sp. JUb56]|uniref:2OG-Fe(II) oxygenase n=1 Tax=Sphingobacterium sp. JUb56 TaxID=2587145 RepID=UPI0016156747|nr:2OG-Fe(II) oxygenase [Sphingobacterium sp. JUb56]MBB2954354.1 Rps23 Pro-64 3,4-dihydroxylase Tpa1-like proline 4-hydroxylase [Sphingobacterium sp. JUb56]
MKRYEYATLIAEKLSANVIALKEEFNQKGRINSCAIDNLLPEDLVQEIYAAFPSPEEMKIYKSLRENKRIAAQMDLYNPLLEEIVFAFQDERVVQIVEEITGIKDMEPDANLYAGGISLMSKGNFLNPHLDNSHDNNRESYRVLNLLYYVSPNWRLENGGNLELWDKGVEGESRVILSKSNRLVLMITNKTSIHSVSKVVVDEKRCCVSNYYFSEKPVESSEYFHVTSFYGRPEEPIKNVVLRADAFLRQTVRKITGKRIVKTDHIYKKKEDNQ